MVCAGGEVAVSVPGDVTITFPVYRYHPQEDMGPGCVGTFKMEETPFPVAGTVSGFLGSLVHGQFEYRSSPESGTQGMGLFRSAFHLSRPQVVPGGLLDAAGRDIPILDYDGPDRPRTGPVAFFAGFAGIAGWRYRHRFTFGAAEQLRLEEFKKRLARLMRQSKGFPRPIHQIEAAGSFLEVMEVEFGRERARHFHKEYRFPNWVRR